MCEKNGKYYQSYIDLDDAQAVVSVEISFVDDNGKTIKKSVRSSQLIPPWDRRMDIKSPFKPVSISEANYLMSTDSEDKKIILHSLGIPQNKWASAGISGYQISEGTKAYSTSLKGEPKGTLGFLLNSKKNLEALKLKTCYWASVESSLGTFDAQTALSCEQGKGVCFGQASCNMKKLGYENIDSYSTYLAYCSALTNGQCPDAETCVKENTSSRKIWQNLSSGEIKVNSFLERFQPREVENKKVRRK